jgi:hypothetical protein
MSTNKWQLAFDHACTLLQRSCQTLDLSFVTLMLLTLLYLYHTCKKKLHTTLGHDAIFMYS